MTTFDARAAAGNIHRDYRSSPVTYILTGRAIHLHQHLPTAAQAARIFHRIAAQRTPTRTAGDAPLTTRMTGGRNLGATCARIPRACGASLPHLPLAAWRVPPFSRFFTISRSCFFAGGGGARVAAGSTTSSIISLSIVCGIYLRRASA